MLYASFLFLALISLSSPLSVFWVLVFQCAPFIGALKGDLAVIEETSTNGMSFRDIPSYFFFLNDVFNFNSYISGDYEAQSAAKAIKPAH